MSEINNVENIKTIPTWNSIRNRIEQIHLYEDEINARERAVKFKVDIYESKINLMISYLFGTSLKETIKQKKDGYTTKGNDFRIETINNSEALILDLRTTIRKVRKRSIAVPLNPKYEKWSKEILDYSEDMANKEIYKTFRRMMQYVIQVLFSDFEYPSLDYIKKKQKGSDRVNVTHKHLSEIREWELGLCHNFTVYDFTHFDGGAYNPDYNIYFDKLLEKNDYYNENDIINATILKNMVFNPSSYEKYHYKVYLDIIRKIKRKYIERRIDENILINQKLSFTKKGGKGGGKEHNILKSNSVSILPNNSKIEYEFSNFDVVDFNNKIIVECGHTSARKLLDCFNNEIKDVQNFTQFWVLQFFDENNMSKLYKFIKSDFYS